MRTILALAALVAMSSVSMAAVFPNTGNDRAVTQTTGTDTNGNTVTIGGGAQGSGNGGSDHGNNGASGSKGHN